MTSLKIQKMAPIKFFLFLLLFVPIFISFSFEGDISFDRWGYSENIYKISGPISLFVVFFLLIKNFITIFSNRELLLVLMFMAVAILTNTLTSDGLGFLKVFFTLFVFILTLHCLEKEFELLGPKLYQVSPDKLLIYILIITYISILIYTPNFHLSELKAALVDSPHVTGTKYFFLFKQFAIYNFAQYYGLIFLLLLGICADKGRVLLFLLTSVLSIFLSFIGENFTGLVLLIAYSLFYLISLLILKERGLLLKQVSQILIFSCIFVLFLYYAVAITYGDVVGKFLPITLRVRIEGVYEFFTKLELIDFLFPLQFDDNPPANYYHNESLSILSTLGLFGTIGLYLYIFKKIIQISNFFPHIAITVSLIIFLAGIVIVPILHSYSSIVLAYVIAYYVVEARKRPYFRLNNNE